MSLYPTILIDPSDATKYFNDLPPDKPNPHSDARLALIPIDMTAITMTQMTLVQASLTQDYSLRAWLSAYPDGIAISPIIPVMRGNGLPIVVYIPPQTPPQNCIPIAVVSGQYYLNVLNLTNEKNIFVFSKTDT